MTRKVTTLENPRAADDRARAAVRPTQEDIAFRAHQIFLKRGAAPGFELEDWLQAERELTVTEPSDLPGQSGSSTVPFSNRRG